MYLSIPFSNNNNISSSNNNQIIAIIVATHDPRERRRPPTHIASSLSASIFIIYDTLDGRTTHKAEGHKASRRAQHFKLRQTSDSGDKKCNGGREDGYGVVDVVRGVLHTSHYASSVVRAYSPRLATHSRTCTVPRCLLVSRNATASLLPEKENIGQLPCVVWAQLTS